jgi:hypothetical protein
MLLTDPTHEFRLAKNAAGYTEKATNYTARLNHPA